MLNQVQIEGQIGKLLETYRKSFERTLGTEPVIDHDTDQENLRVILNKVGLERATILIDAYFSIKNEWVKERGFPTSYLRKNLNEVIASCSKYHKRLFPKYVVGFCVDGTPVTSEDPEALKGHCGNFKPMPVDDWNKLSDSHKDFYRKNFK